MPVFSLKKKEKKKDELSRIKRMIGNLLWLESIVRRCHGVPSVQRMDST